MQLQGTRTFLEPRVGTKHSVEVILHLRQVDLEWFNNSNDNDTENDHFQQVLQLLSDSMIPRMCHDEVEQYFQNHDPLRFPKDGDDKIGEKNNTTNNINNKKRKQRGGKKQQPAVNNVGQGQQQDGEEKTQRGVNNNQMHYAFGESLYCAYKTEDINPVGSATLVFKKKETGDDNDNDTAKTKHSKDGKLGGGAFLQLKKLSKRFLVYCFKYDPKDPGAPDPPDAGYLGTLRAVYAL
jgi:hypothetical protein